MDNNSIVLINKAKLAQELERFDDMLEFMIEFVSKKDSILSSEERNLFFIANRNVLGSQRISYRFLKNHQKNLTEKSNKGLVIAEYLMDIENNIIELCNNTLKIIEGCMSYGKDNYENQIFFLKMRADYFRYLAEVSVKLEDMFPADEAERAYNEASKLASLNLTATDPIRLSLALNFSLFYFEIKCERDKACEITKAAFIEAMKEFDSLTKETYNDTSYIMEILLDHLNTWSYDDDQYKNIGFIF